MSPTKGSSCNRNDVSSGPNVYDGDKPALCGNSNCNCGDSCACKPDECKC
ncbi:910_t:CDS:2 [Ambispora leptoticha]|uniref:910_t:CDS:1 n=1 Tax=Ambispora leptoticha TaxID=144679 RepID=A0A9N9FU67_9GLOM|nr:910_t:CDS:2 [Ambispora leptoticha]